MIAEKESSRAAPLLILRGLICPFQAPRVLTVSPTTLRKTTGPSTYRYLNLTKIFIQHSEYATVIDHYLTYYQGPMRNAANCSWQMEVPGRRPLKPRRQNVSKFPRHRGLSIRSPEVQSTLELRTKPISKSI
jgi:hypothetical protein